MKTLSFLLLALLLSSCTYNTDRLWKNSTYTEVVSAFLITEDGQKLAIIGKSYHYIFKLDNSLKKILLSKERKNVTPLFFYFKVDGENNVSGRFSLVYISKNENNNVAMEKLGFKGDAHKNKKQTRYSFKVSISGQRYSSKEDITTNVKFNKPYTIKVEESQSTLGKLARILATPVTVALDGAYTIAGIQLIPAATAMGVTLMGINSK